MFISKAGTHCSLGGTAVKGSTKTPWAGDLNICYKKGKKNEKLPGDFSSFLNSFKKYIVIKIPSKLSSIFLVPNTKRPYFPQGFLSIPILCSGHLLPVSISAHLHFPRQTNKYSVRFRTACLCLNHVSLLTKLLFGSKTWAFGQWALLMFRQASLEQLQSLPDSICLVLSLVLEGALHLVKQSWQREM